MNFTLVSTVYNEAHRLQTTIDELSSQTIQPTEIIITDAGSNDGTYEMLSKWKEESSVPVILFQKPRCNVAEGRNIAIKAATTKIIVSTDFGCRFHAKWLESIITPFADDDVAVVGGSYMVIEKEQLSLAARAAYLLANGYMPNVNSPAFIPSSRSIAYRKCVFDHIGGYCEWLTLAADDLVFGLELKSKGYNFFKVDKPYVYWGRHENVKGYIKESFRYGLGDGEAKVNSKRFSEIVLQFALYAFNLLVVLAFIFYKISLILLTGLLAFDIIMFSRIYTFYPKYLLRWYKMKTSKYNFEVFLFGIYLRERINLAYIRGYIKGYFFSTAYQKEQAKKLRGKLKAI